MKVLLRPDTSKIPGFVIARSFEEVGRLKGKIDVLVIQSSPEKGSVLVEQFTQVIPRANRVLYVSSPENQDPELVLLVKGCGGQIVEDEYFLNSSEELENLVTLSSTDLVTQSDMGEVRVLGSFIDQLVEGRSHNFSDKYLELVTRSSNEMVRKYEEKTAQVTRVSREALKLISDVQEGSNQSRAETQKMKQLLGKLKSQVEELNSSASLGTPSTGSITYFPRVPYDRQRNMLLVKKLGSTPYLVSFFLGFHRYLDEVAGRKPKLIFLFPLGRLYQERYKDFAWVDRDSSRSSNLTQDIVFVNHPTQTVIQDLLSDEINYDSYIIVDCTVNQPQHLVKRSRDTWFTALSSEGIREQFKIQPNRVLSFGKVSNSFLQVEPIQDYPDNQFARLSAYSKAYGANFSILSGEVR